MSAEERRIYYVGGPAHGYNGLTTTAMSRIAVPCMVNGEIGQALYQLVEFVGGTEVLRGDIALFVEDERCPR